MTDPKTRTIAVMQGEHKVSNEANDVLFTVLGSCVAACMRDPVAAVGGLNHFLLPGGTADEPQAMKYGLHAMELLINSLIHAGAERHRLEAKLFGGARMQIGLPDIGRSNATFAEEFLRREGIRYLGGSLGGNQGRKIRYWPVSGLVQQLRLRTSELPPERPALPATASDGSVTLF